MSEAFSFSEKSAGQRSIGSGRHEKNTQCLGAKLAGRVGRRVNTFRGEDERDRISEKTKGTCLREIDEDTSLGKGERSVYPKTLEVNSVLLDMSFEV